MIERALNLILELLSFIFSHLVEIVFGGAFFLLGLALTIYYWQLMVPAWIGIAIAGFRKDKKFCNTSAWLAFILCAWFLFSEFPPAAKTAADYCSWRDCPDAPDDRGDKASCSKFCGD